MLRVYSNHKSRFAFGDRECGRWLFERAWVRVHRTASALGHLASAHVVLTFAITALCRSAAAADLDVAGSFRKTVEPVLDKFCSGCHNSELKKGGIIFDVEDPAPLLKDQEVWLKTLKMLRAGMMPPRGKRRPSAEQVAQVENWIKYSAFAIDPKDPDPGRVTIRRLNRTEYRNTIRELTGVDFNATAEFPADDTGHGFDNISDVLTLSPLLLEEIYRRGQVDRHPGCAHAAFGAGRKANSRPAARPGSARQSERPT